MTVTCIATKHPDIVVEQSLMRENVRIFRRKEIPPEQKKKLKVAAYCRVSTDREEQESSIRIQMEAYRQIIEEHPEWQLAEIYADPGITGTSVKKRKEFLRMIEDAKAGKIDIIIAKSISRFARNTEDMLRYTRLLKDIGVGVVFEKEKIDTRSTTSEMLLTIYAAFSQEEAHDISEWEKNGIRNDAARGKTRFHSLYGYTSKGKKKWIAVPEEAEVVKRIFTSFVKGYSGREIAEQLNQEGIPFKMQTKWSSASVKQILRNEKYAGDYLFQKTYVDNFLTRRNVKNKDMKLPQYYITDDHEALIPRELYTETQEIIYMRSRQNGASLYPYYGFLMCPECGTPLVSAALPFGTSGKYWVCPRNREGLKRSERSDCKPFAFSEKLIDEAVGKAITDLKGTGGEEAREIRNRIVQSGRIERWYLKTMVKQITFPDGEHLTVHRKNGGKITVPLAIKNVRQHPYSEDRSLFVQNLEITVPDSACKEGIVKCRLFP